MKKDNSQDILTYVLIGCLIVLIFGGAAVIDHRQNKEMLELEKEKLRLEIKLKRLELGYS